PVSTRVPSMSNRMSRWSGSAFAANVAASRPLGRGLFFEVDALAFIQLVEAALDGAPVEEPLLTAVVADETKSSVAHESLDRTARHPSLLWARVPRLGLSSSVPKDEAAVS